MNIKILSIACLLLLSLVSCNMKKAERAIDKAFEEYQKEEPKEAEKKPAIFYQRLLESFCQRYYNTAFNRTYHSNSIIVDNVSVIQGNWEDGVIVSWNMMVKGRHSFEGFLRNHNDSPFEAFVDELGNDSYEITFCIRRYGPFGEQLEERESATRTMTFSE